MSSPQHAEKLYERIYANVRTTDERGIVYTGIETLLDTLYKQKGNIAALIETEMPSAIVRPLKQELLRLSETAPDSIKEYLEGLQNTLEKLQVLSIEIAYSPTEETLAVLTAWMREHIGADVIMELSVDRTLLGGARISYEGRYKEINLAFIVETVVNQQHESIQLILEHKAP